MRKIDFVKTGDKQIFIFIDKHKIGLEVCRNFEVLKLNGHFVLNVKIIDAFFKFFKGNGALARSFIRTHFFHCSVGVEIDF